jgi:succinyl-CoA:acetate CoA-transferase
MAVVEAVAVGEDWFAPSAANGPTPAFVESADRLVVEVNRAVPRAVGQFHDVYRLDAPPDRGRIPIDAPGERIADERVEFDPEKLAAVVETDRLGEPYSFRDPNGVDRDIADNLRSLLEAQVERSPLFADSLRIQVGVGSLGNALMGALGDAEFGDRDLIYFERSSRTACATYLTRANSTPRA